MVSLSIVIPVYRGAQTIGELMATLTATLPTITNQYEVIMVEDDGGDDSWQVIERLSQQYSHLRGIKLMRNSGQHAALLCGIRAARHEIVVTMDDDLQHPATEIPRLLAELDQGYDVVYGTPQTKQHNLGRKLGSFLIRFALGNAMGVDTARHVSAFRAFRTHLRDSFAHYSSPYVSLDVLLSWGTRRFSHTSVAHAPRTVGESGYSFIKLLNLAITMLTGFSVFPLRLASYLGFGLTVFGIILLIYIVPIRLYVLNYSGVPGFTFLASMISIFSGTQMFTIGIIGEYLARMHFRLMDKPPYTAHRFTGNVQSEDIHETSNI
ncbi:MAG: glycosyltransferase family 2 protein [Anaerolineae bacterium]